MPDNIGAEKYIPQNYVIITIIIIIVIIIIITTIVTMLSNGSLANTGWAKFERKWRREGNLSKETRGIYNFNSQNIWEENDDDDGGDHDDGDGDGDGDDL